MLRWKIKRGQHDDLVPLHTSDIQPVWFGEVKSVPNISRITLSRFKAKEDWFNLNFFTGCLNQLDGNNYGISVSVK